MVESCVSKSRHHEDELYVDFSGAQEAMDDRRSLIFIKENGTRSH